MKSQKVSVDLLIAAEYGGAVKFAGEMCEWLANVTGDSARGEIADVMAYLHRRIKRALRTGDLHDSEQARQVRDLALAISEEAGKLGAPWSVFKQYLTQKIAIMRRLTEDWA